MNIFDKYESEVRSYCRKYPVIFSKANNAHLFSCDGKKYIDFLAVAGSMNYGHNNSYIKKQVLDYLSDNNILNALDMFTSAKRDFIDTFVNKILNPRNLNYKIMFCGPTGTNAVEAALKLARKNTKRTNVVAFGGAFHGMTLGSLALTTDRMSRTGANLPLNEVTHIPYEGTNGIDSLEYLKWMLFDDHSGIDKPAAVVVETVQAEGGVNVASVEWLKKLKTICQDNGLLLIVDDIQVGCGRTGMFFSFERANIIPDMVVLSKSISGIGFPMSLLLIRPELDVFNPAEHNGTFRGNQLAFVSGKAAIDYYCSHELDKVVLDKSRIIYEELTRMSESLDKRLVIRGIGMIWGIDFSLIDGSLAIKVIKKAFEEKLILEVAGRGDSVVKVMPPLTIENDVLIEGLQKLVNVIKEVLLW